MPSASRHSKPSFKLALILGPLAMFGPFGIDMYLSGFTSMAADFHVNVSKIQVTLSIYFLGLALGQILYGPLIDHFGRRRPLLAGLSVFFLSSLALTFMPNINCFIAVRLLQAMGGCAGMVAGRAVVRDLFDLRQSAKMFSMLGVVQGLGPILAPVLGSLMLSVWSWRSVFYFAAGFGLLCILISSLGLPETLPRAARRPVNFSRTLRDYWQVMLHRPFWAPALAGGLAGSCMFAYISGSSFVFMGLFGVTSRQYGLIFAANAAGTILAAQLNNHLLRRFSPRRLMLAAIVSELITVSLMFAAIALRAPMAIYMIPLWLSIAVMPVIFANSVALAMQASHEKAGIASALLGVIQFVIASLSSGLVSLLHNGTAYPMAAVMFLMAAAGLAVRLLPAPGSPAESIPAEPEIQS